MILCLSLILEEILTLSRSKETLRIELHEIADQSVCEIRICGSYSRGVTRSSDWVSAEQIMLAHEGQIFIQMVDGQRTETRLLWPIYGPKWANTQRRLECLEFSS